MSWLRRVATVALISLLALGALWLALRLAGLDATRALLALWDGSFGSSYALTSSTLVRATPLILTGLAVALAFRAGVWNIGAEGQLLAGAATAAAVGLFATPAFGALTVVAALAVGALAGALWAWVAAYLRNRFGVLEVISTIMLNFVALYAVGYLVRGPLQEPTHIYPQSKPLPALAQLPRLIEGSRLHWGFVLAVAAAPIVWWVLRYTAAGFRVRAVGQNPSAARVAGMVDVQRTTMGVFLVSGALAGLAGAIELTGVTFALYENVSPGYGYTAIAVALLAGLDPLGVLATGLLFGALEAGALSMQREAAVPAVVVNVVEALLVLLVLAVAKWRGGSPLLARLAGSGSGASGDDSTPTGGGGAIVSGGGSMRPDAPPAGGTQAEAAG
ncbi:MAG TPA: ABC transporter permease [Gammaproteobacteria bacterium]|nr:ABC transporter permease [Gammaproteobacteria bacterium]